MDIRELNKRLKSFDMEFSKELAVRKSSKLIIDFNRYQMRQGKDAKNGMITPFYSKNWAKYKESLSTYGLTGKKVNLFLTGSFQKEMYLIITNGEYFIHSQNEKTPKLKEKYGNDIFGLNRDSNAEIKPIVTNEFMKIFRQKTGI